MQCILNSIHAKLSTDDDDDNDDDEY